MLTPLVVALLAAPPCRAVELTARFDDALTYVEGTIACDVAADGPLAVATYPRVLKDSRAAALTDINRTWVYPHGFSPADMQLTMDGKPLQGEGAWQELGEHRAGERVVLHFTTRIPERRGPFGFDGGTAYLFGGWHPAFGGQNRLQEADVTYRIVVPPGRVGFVGDKPFGRYTSRLAVGKTHGKFVPVVLARAAHTRTAANSVLFVPEGHASDITDGLRERAETEILRTLAEGDAFAISQGLAVESRLVVLAPLREHLVERFDGGIAVSDRAFLLLPWEQFLKFHRLALWREQFSAAAKRPYAAAPSCLPADLTEDLLGVALRDRLTLARYGDTHDAAQILEGFALTPSIDALIFAPQVPFPDAYYNSLDETPLTRWRLDDFYHRRPRGKVIYEKLRDALGDAVLAEAVDISLRQATDFVQTLDRLSQVNVCTLLAPWLHAYPRVNYRLGESTCKDGVFTLHIEGDGAEAATLHEPLTVQVEDHEGLRRRLSRLGPGPVTSHLRCPARRLVLDPDRRVVELLHPPGYAAYFDNVRPAAWRFLFDDFWALWAATGNELTAGLSFSLRRLHDLKWSWGAAVAYTSTENDVAVRAVYHFGAEVTPLRLAHRLALSAAFEYLRVVPGALEPARQGALKLSYVYDNRLSNYASLEGFAVDGYASAAVGSANGTGRYDTEQLGLGILNIWQVSFRQALVTRLRGDVSLGTTPPQGAFPLGDRYLSGRGFENDEVRGNRRAVLSAEYRHVLTAETRTNLWGVFYANRVEGGLFADAVYLPVRRAGCNQDMFYDVGYGVHILGEILNISPGALGVDIGLPIARCPDEVGSHFPVTVYFALAQSFLTF